MVLFSGRRKYLAALILATFFASASLAAADDLSLQSDTVSRTMHPTNESPTKISSGINSECFTGYFINLRSVIAAPERKDMPVGSMNECFEDTAAITLHKDGDKIIWSLVPSLLGRFSLNPIDDIKNLQVVLKYRF